MKCIFAFGLVGMGVLSAGAVSSQEILVNQYDVLIQHDKLDIFQKTGKELNTSEGRAIVTVACAYFGCDPDKVNAGIAGAAKLIVPSGTDPVALRRFLSSSGDREVTTRAVYRGTEGHDLRLIEYFEGPKVPARQRVGRMILNWVFSSDSKARRFRYCCDACAQQGRQSKALSDHVMSVFACF